MAVRGCGEGRVRVEICAERGMRWKWVREVNYDVLKHTAVLVPHTPFRLYPLPLGRTTKLEPYTCSCHHTQPIPSRACTPTCTAAERARAARPPPPLATLSGAQIRDLVAKHTAVPGAGMAGAAGPDAGAAGECALSCLLMYAHLYTAVAVQLCKHTCNNRAAQSRTQQPQPGPMATPCCCSQSTPLHPHAHICWLLPRWQPTGT